MIAIDLIVDVVVVVIVSAAAAATVRTNGVPLVGAVGILRKRGCVPRIRGADLCPKLGGLCLQASASPLGVALLEHGPAALGWVGDSGIFIIIVFVVLAVV